MNTENRFLYFFQPQMLKYSLGEENALMHGGSDFHLT